MISPHDDNLHHSSGAAGGHASTRVADRQRSARNDPSMRDGDSGRGNPYESDADEFRTDEDVGDAVFDMADPSDAIPLDDEEPEARNSGSVLLPNSEAAVVPTATTTDTGAERTGTDDTEFEEDDEVTAEAEAATGAWNHAPAAAADREDRSNENNRAIRNEPRPSEVKSRHGRDAQPARKSSHQVEASVSARTDPHLPIPSYHDLTVPQILERVYEMPIEQAKMVQRYEGVHLRRKTLLVKLERYLRNK